MFSNVGGNPNLEREFGKATIDKLRKEFKVKLNAPDTSSQDFNLLIQTINNPKAKAYVMDAMLGLTLAAQKDLTHPETKHNIVIIKHPEHSSDKPVVLVSPKNTAMQRAVEQGKKLEFKLPDAEGGTLPVEHEHITVIDTKSWEKGLAQHPLVTGEATKRKTEKATSGKPPLHPSAPTAREGSKEDLKGQRKADAFAAKQEKERRQGINFNEKMQEKRQEEKR